MAWTENLLQDSVESDSHCTPNESGEVGMGIAASDKVQLEPAEAFKASEAVEERRDGCEAQDVLATANFCRRLTGLERLIPQQERLSRFSAHT